MCLEAYDEHMLRVDASGTSESDAEAIMRKNTFRWSWGMDKVDVEWKFLSNEELFMQCSNK